MKIRLYHLAVALIILFISTNICLSQDSNTIRISKGGKTVLLKDVLTEERGKKKLLIAEKETIEFLLDDNVILVSSDPQSVVVIDNNSILGIKADAEVELTAISTDDDSLTINGENKLVVKVQDSDASRQIVAQSTFLTYKTVKDSFGKKFAQSYFVVQVDIRNEKLNKQFIVQTLDVLIDPNQCENGKTIYRDFNEILCRKIFNDYFIFPNGQQPVRREELIASGKADLNRSDRNVGFRLLAFTATIGTILTGIDGFLGRDGVKGINVLGTTFTDGAKLLFPNTADEKLENLKNAIPTEDVIIKSKESKTFNIFIPTERIFYEDSWKKYIKPTRDSDKDTYSLKVVLDLLLLSSASGVLVNNDAPTVTVKSDDAFRKQVEKFGITLGEATKDEIDRTDEYLETLNALRKAIVTKPTKAKELYVKIVKELRLESHFRGYLDGMSVRENSASLEIDGAIRKLSRSLGSDNTNDNAELIKKLQNIVIILGK